MDREYKSYLRENEYNELYWDPNSALRFPISCRCSLHHSHILYRTTKHLEKRRCDINSQAITIINDCGSDYQSEK